MPITRREILGSGAAASLLPLVGSLGRTRDTDLDVAIVGGGVSGAYTAWRLRSEAPQLRLRLFEMSDRIGGRLRSIAFPQSPHLVGEAGGMRFLESQKHVFPLVKALGLPMRGYPITEPQDRLALRGRTFSYAEMGRPTKLYPYNIPPGEQAPNSDFYIRAVERIIPGVRSMTPDRWRAMRSTFRYKGRLLKDWAAWTLLSQVFSHEELAFIQDTGGYDDFILHGTALDQFDFIFLGDDESKPFFTIAGGYQKLPLMLAVQAMKLGAPIAMQSRLVSLALPERPGAPFTLAFEDHNGRSATVTAARVVLALPRHAIESIPESPARRDPHVAALLASVDPIPACKAFLLYPKPWWRDLGIAGGRSVTDMPARQLYALGAEKERLPSESANGHGLLMMYCDANTVEYWKELAPSAKAEAAGFSWLAGDSQLAAEMHREASLVYAARPPKPIAACFQDWTAEPYGGAWHFWGAGKDSALLADRVMQPIPGRDLFICGEAYCQYEAGWVEGALERAETMLQRHFGLKPGKWL